MGCKSVFKKLVEQKRLESRTKFRESTQLGVKKKETLGVTIFLPFLSRSIFSGKKENFCCCCCILL
jgi:hypothetical protein